MAKKFISDEEMDSIPPKKFISDEEMDTDMEDKISGPVGTALDQAANIMTMGYGPQIETIAEGLLSPKRSIKQSIPGSPEYIARRDQIIRELKGSQEENPNAALVGTGLGIAGAIAGPGPLSAVSKIKDIPTLAKVGLAGLAGGAEFLAQNPGDQPGVYDPTQVYDRLAMAQESPISAALSVALPSVTPALGGNKAKEIASEKAFELIKPKAKMYEEGYRASPESAKSIQNVGKYAIESGIVSASPVSNFEKMWNKSNELMRETGRKIGEANQEARATINRWLNKIVDPQKIDLKEGTSPKDARVAQNYVENIFIDVNYKKKILDEIKSALRFKPGKAEALKRAEAYLDNIWSEVPNPELDTLQEMRTALGETIKDWSKTNGEISETQVAWKIIRKNVDQAIDNEFDAFEKISGKPAEIKKLRKDYTSNRVINDAVLDNLVKEKRKNVSIPIIGPATLMGGLASSNTPATVIGAGLIGLHGVKNYMNSIPGKSATIHALHSLGEPSGMLPSMAGRAAIQEAKMREPTIGGFPEVDTIEIDPIDEMALSQQIRKQDISAVEKSKRLNLLSKYKRVLRVPLQ